MDIQNISKEEFESIEAYLNGQLSGDALNKFETKLKKNNVYKAKVDYITTIINGIETQALSEKLNEFHNELEPDNSTKGSKKIRRLNWKKMAVAAVLIIGATSFWFINGNANDRLYAKYFTPDPGLPTTMSTTKNYDFSEAMVYYKQGKYNEALQAWKTLLNTNVESDTLNYFIGSALMANKNENEAIQYLNKVIELDEKTFNNEAYYYLGLAYLKTNVREKAINALKKSNLPKSKDLLKNLD